MRCAKANEIPFPLSNQQQNLDFRDGWKYSMTVIQQELTEAVSELDHCYAELVDQAREQLGHLFDRSDYPTSMTDLFEISWDFPSVTPPSYLRMVNPELYAAECQRVQAKFAKQSSLLNKRSPKNWHSWSAILLTDCRDRWTVRQKSFGTRR